MARMINRQEAATLLNVSAQTISNWVERGVLNGHFSCDGRKTMFIDRKSIEQYFDSLKDLSSMEKRIALQKKTLEEENFLCNETYVEVEDLILSDNICLFVESSDPNNKPLIFQTWCDGVIVYGFLE